MAKPTPATTGAETDNKEKKINLISNLSNEDRYAYDTIKLREIKGHEWWLITLLILMFLSPFIAIWISTVNHFERPRLLYLLVSGILIVIWFFCHFIYYLNRVQEYETSSKEGKVYRIGNNSIVDDRWKKIWGIYNKNYPKRVRKYIIGLLRLELFGWITWTTAVVVAISEQLALTLNLNSANSFKIAEAISNQISSNGGAIPTVASINEIIMQQLKLTPQNLWEHYSIVMENASYGLARATVLGIITLFFTQMLKFYQANITLNYDAAESAKKAATDSNKAIGEIKEFRKALHSELENHKDIIKGSYGIVDGEWLFLNLIKLVSNIQDQVKNIKFAKLIEPLKTQIQKITIELAKSNEDNDKTEFNALTVLQSTYFETEALNFEEPVGVDSYKEEENKPDTLRKGVRLSTNYTHYAKAVQSLVDTFESEPSHAYEYYTILNEKQDGFFNIENDKVNLRWQVSFLEEQCRKHANKEIRFSRYFSECDNSPEGKGKLYPPRHNVESSMEYILCDSEKNPKLFINPDELNSELKQILQKASLTLDQYKTICEINDERMAQSFDRKKDDLKRDVFTRPQSYIIKIDERTGGNKFATKFNQLLKDKGVNDLHFEKLTDILINNYHSHVTPPRLIKFADKDDYDKFFSGEGQIPRDLVAVRRDNQWKFCLGVMIGSDIPTAVTLVFITEKRELNDLSWQQLTQKLDILFEKDANNDWINSRKISHESFG